MVRCVNESLHLNFIWIQDTLNGKCKWGLSTSPCCKLDQVYDLVSKTMLARVLGWILGGSGGRTNEEIHFGFFQL